MNQVCIYHAGCPDGFGAAWAVWKVWGDEARYIPRGHEDPLRARDFEDVAIAKIFSLNMERVFRHATGAGTRAASASLTGLSVSADSAT